MSLFLQERIESRKALSAEKLQLVILPAISLFTTQATTEKKG